MNYVLFGGATEEPTAEEAAMRPPDSPSRRRKSRDRPEPPYRRRAVQCGPGRGAAWSRPRGRLRDPRRVPFTREFAKPVVCSVQAPQQDTLCGPTFRRMLVGNPLITILRNGWCSLRAQASTPRLLSGGRGGVHHARDAERPAPATPLGGASASPPGLSTCLQAQAGFSCCPPVPEAEACLVASRARD